MLNHLISPGNAIRVVMVSFSILCSREGSPINFDPCHKLSGSERLFTPARRYSLDPLR